MAVEFLGEHFWVPIDPVEFLGEVDLSVGGFIGIIGGGIEGGFFCWSCGIVGDEKVLPLSPIGLFNRFWTGVGLF